MKYPKSIKQWIDHSTWSHAGKQDRHCAACVAGIGSQVIRLKPIKKPKRKSKEKL